MTSYWFWAFALILPQAHGIGYFPSMVTKANDGEPAAQATTTVEVTDRASDYLRSLDRMIRLTGLADSKAAPLLAVQATLLAVTATQLDKVADLLRDGTAAEVGAVFVLGAVYLICTMISASMTLRVFLPKDAPGQNSMLFFADIADMTLHDFVTRSMTMSDEELERDALEQTHAVARLVALKLQLVRRALIVLVVALAAWLGLMAVANY